MKSTYLTAATSLALAAALSAPVLTANPGDTEQGVASAPTFSDLDSNRDGYLTEDEARNRIDLLDNWQRADSNQDGQIDRSEFAAFEVDESSKTPSHEEPMPGNEQSPSGSQPGGSINPPTGGSPSKVY